MRVTRFVGGMYDDFTNELSVPARALMPLFEAADQHANEMPTVKDAPRPPQALRSHCSVDEVSDSCTSTCAANGRTSTYSHYVLNRAAQSGHSPRGNTSTACWNHQQELPQAMRTHCSVDGVSDTGPADDAASLANGAARVTPGANGTYPTTLYSPRPLGQATECNGIKEFSVCTDLRAHSAASEHQSRCGATLQNVQQSGASEQSSARPSAATQPAGDEQQKHQKLCVSTNSPTPCKASGDRVLGPKYPISKGEKMHGEKATEDARCDHVRPPSLSAPR
jgi:hypothetical protein